MQRVGDTRHSWDLVYLLFSWLDHRKGAAADASSSDSNSTVAIVGTISHSIKIVVAEIPNASSRKKQPSQAPNAVAKRIARLRMIAQMSPGDVLAWRELNNAAARKYRLRECTTEEMQVIQSKKRIYNKSYKAMNAAAGTVAKQTKRADLTPELQERRRESNRQSKKKVNARKLSEKIA